MDPDGGSSPYRVDSPDSSATAQPGAVPVTPRQPDAVPRASGPTGAVPSASDAVPPASGAVPPAHRSSRPVRLFGGVAVLGVVAMVASCVGLLFWLSPPPNPREGESAPRTFCCELAAPLRIAPVVRVDPGPCTAGSVPARTAGDGCFVLGQGGMTVQTVERLSPIRIPASSSGPSLDQWVLELEFEDRDAAAFAQLTRQLVGKQLALVFDGTVLVAPQISEPALDPDRAVQISGQLTENDVDELFDRLTRA